MWNKRKDEEYPSRPATGGTSFTAPVSSPSPTPPPAPVREPAAPVAAPVRIPETDYARGGPAMIGKSVAIKGQIYSREDITIDGEVEGSIEALEHRVTIGPNGRVKATLKAREIVVLGQVYGNIEAGEKAEVRREARLIGDIRTMRIMIEDGAFFKGSIDIVRADAGRPRKESSAASSASPSQAAFQVPAVEPDSSVDTAGVQR
jgi:cytoskeletal protein CcmA (bactofilin family)